MIAYGRDVKGGRLPGEAFVISIDRISENIYAWVSRMGYESESELMVMKEVVV